MVSGLLLFVCSCGSESQTPLCERELEACELQESPEPGAPGTSCLDGTPCEPGAVCAQLDATSAVCVPGCSTPGQMCPEGGVCVETRGGDSAICLAGSAKVGEVCASALECSPGMSCLGDGMVGRCAMRCEAPGGLCEDGSLCMSTQGGGAPVCVWGGEQPEGAECASSAECERGLRCMTAGEQKLCVRACEDESQCRDGASCEPLMGDVQGSVCRPGVGAACVSDSTCPEMTQCSASFADPFFFANAWPQGVCSSEGCEAGACAPGSACRPVVEASTSVCAPTCESDADCRVTQGWRCLDASACEERQSGCLDYFGSQKLCHRPDRVWVLR